MSNASQSGVPRETRPSVISGPPNLPLLQAHLPSNKTRGRKGRTCTQFGVNPVRNSRAMKSSPPTEAESESWHPITLRG